MRRKCMTCRKEFDGEAWMSQCRDCYRDFKGQKRIANARDICGRYGFFVASMPDVTTEEMVDWVNKFYGKGQKVCPSPNYWEPIKVRPHMELWWVDTYDD
jgi:hypothetical protein